MGGTIRSKEVQTFVKDEGSNILLDGSATTIFGLQLEDSLGNGFLREEGATITRPSRIVFDGSDSDGLGNGDILLEDGSNDGESSVLLKEGSETVEITGAEDRDWETQYEMVLL